MSACLTKHRAAAHWTLFSEKSPGPLKISLAGCNWPTGLTLDVPSIQLHTVHTAVPKPQLYPEKSLVFFLCIFFASIIFFVFFFIPSKYEPILLKKQKTKNSTTER